LLLLLLCLFLPCKCQRTVTRYPRGEPSGSRQYRVSKAVAQSNRPGLPALPSRAFTVRALSPCAVHA
jgi:hypothetical protein